MSKKKLGANHPDILTSMNNLVFIWKETGRETEAIRLMEECIQLQKLVSGPNYLNTLLSYRTLVVWKAE